MNTDQEKDIKAADEMDWGQVVMNGGPPCFHVCADGKFCGRAERWDGHNDIHPFRSLSNLIADQASKEEEKT